MIVPDGADAAAATSAMVAMDRRGVVTAAWVRQFDDGPFQLVAATRSRTGIWSDPTIVEEVRAQSLYDPPVSDPRLAVNADGSAVLGWTRVKLTDVDDEDSQYEEARAAYRPAGGDWQASVQLGRRGNFVGDLGIDDDGVATVAVLTAHDMRAFRYAGGRWGRGEVIAHQASGDLAVGADGAAAVVLVKCLGRGDCDHQAVFASHRQGDAWTTPKRLSGRDPGSPYYENPSLAIGSGTTTIAFASWDGPVRVVTRPREGDYSTSRAIARAPAQQSGGVQSVLGVWANRQGQALTIWGRAGDDGGWVPEASYRAETDGMWTAPVALSAGQPTTEDYARRFAGVSAVVYPNGSVRVLWSDGQDIRLRQFGRAD